MSAFVKNTAAGLCCLSFAGCAADYHAYPNGCVPYTYEVPAPLPYTQYSSCPTPVATRYFQQRADIMSPLPAAPRESGDQAPKVYSTPPE